MRWRGLNHSRWWHPTLPAPWPKPPWRPGWVPAAWWCSSRRQRSAHGRGHKHHPGHQDTWSLRRPPRGSPPPAAHDPLDRWTSRPPSRRGRRTGTHAALRGRASARWTSSGSRGWGRCSGGTRRPRRGTRRIGWTTTWPRSCGRKRPQKRGRRTRGRVVDVVGVKWVVCG